MARFAYTAKDREGRRREGTVEAPDRRTAVVVLQSQGVMPVSLAEVTAAAAPDANRKAAPDKPDRKAGNRPAPASAKPAAAAKPAPEGAPPTAPRRRMKSRDQLNLTRELSDLIASGMTLGDALHVLARRDAGRATAQSEIVAALRDQIIRGRSLSQALADFPQDFTPLYVSMVRAGEAAGALAETLDRIAHHMERTQAAREKVLSALVYPVIVLSVGVATMIFIMVYVVPRFASMFEGLGRAMPAATRILIGISVWFTGWRAALLLGVIVLLVALLRQWRRTPAGGHAWDRALLRLPIVRSIAASSAYMHFAQTLSSLLANGVPILQALTIVEQTVGNRVVAGEIRAARERVTDGSSISEPLAAGGVFPRLLTDMLAVGERSGNVPGALQHIARRYENELDRSVKIMTTMLEPILIVVMAVLVGFVVISLLLAVFDITSGLKV